MPPFLVRAVNTAADSENRIHDDQVAAEYGFQGGLVPGVTVYGYMASALIAHAGSEWLMRGAMDVRFFEPFYEGEQVSVSVDEEAGRWILKAGSRAKAAAWLEAVQPMELPAHELLRKEPSRETIFAGAPLGSFDKTLDLSDSGMAAPLDAFIGDERVAHPAILLALANELLVRNYTLGPWIHSSSEVRNMSAVRDGETVTVRGRIVRAFERKGHEFAVCDVTLSAGPRHCANIRHTAIWKPRKVHSS